MELGGKAGARRKDVRQRKVPGGGVCANPAEQELTAQVWESQAIRPTLAIAEGTKSRVANFWVALT